TGFIGFICLELDSIYSQVLLRRQCEMTLNAILLVNRMQEQNSKLESEIQAREQIEKELEFQAFHDALTKLPNRALFFDRLKQAEAMAARRPDFKFAILFVDLDGFKLHNDTLGHEAG